MADLIPQIPRQLEHRPRSRSDVDAGDSDPEPPVGRVAWSRCEGLLAETIAHSAIVGIESAAGHGASDASRSFWA